MYRMGLILNKIFEYVESQAGFDGRIKLVEALGISKDKAKTVGDDPEIIDFAKQQAGKILGKDIGKLIR